MRIRGVVVRTVTVVGAWLPFFAFWVLFILSFGKSTVSQAVSSGLVSIGGGAILGVAVWRFCSIRPWPARVQPLFYVKHLAAASVYAVAWLTADDALEAVLRGKPVLEYLRATISSGLAGWQFLMGVWLYGVIAGISYAIQIRRAATESERRVLRAEAALVEARLAALRNRLNPHFLFNALHTVGALVRQDAARAEDAVEKLGDILRRTLADDGRESIPFREEWDLTQRYLEFEQLRYEERLRVSTDIDANAFDCETPAFALQTLVENAVRHSIASRVEGGKVEITARVESSRLRIRVRDDGTGGGPRSPSAAGSGYGLKALQERLEAVYGGAASLAIRDDGGDGFEVSLEMPCRPPVAPSSDLGLQDDDA